MEIILTLICLFSIDLQATAIVNGEHVYDSTIEVTVDDHVSLISKGDGFWYEIRPIQKEYDNLALGVKGFTPIQYQLINLNEISTLNLGKLEPGTYSFVKGIFNDISFESTESLQHKFSGLIQVVVRECDSYIGYLTELLGLPFIFPPKTIPGVGHQTDLRLGTDCAELAIYGKRRMGFNIPYGGPIGIKNYVIETDEVFPGLILHFGHQVSVLYEDRGIIGLMDGKDILIHAYQNKVKLQSFDETDLFDQHFIKMTWKDDFSMNQN